MRKLISTLVISLLLPLSMIYADSNIDWEVLSSGATDGGSASLTLVGTVGQTATGGGTSDNLVLNQGYWQIFTAGGVPCQGRCGDANNDTKVNVSDAVYIINFVFTGGGAPIPVLACGDASNDSKVNVSDAVYIINFVFSGGNSPGICSPDSPNWHDGICCPFVK